MTNHKKEFDPFQKEKKGKSEHSGTCILGLSKWKIVMSKVNGCSRVDWKYAGFRKYQDWIVIERGSNLLSHNTMSLLKPLIVW